MIPLFPFKAMNMNAMMGQAMKNNPQMQKVMDYVNQNGGDPKTAFYKLAGEMGVDPEEILKQCAMLK